MFRLDTDICGESIGFLLIEELLVYIPAVHASYTCWLILGRFENNTAFCFFIPHTTGHLDRSSSVIVTGGLLTLVHSMFPPAEPFAFTVEFSINSASC